jgi:hypothetical protein
VRQLQVGIKSLNCYTHTSLMYRIAATSCRVHLLTGDILEADWLLPLRLSVNSRLFGAV